MTVPSGQHRLFIILWLTLLAALTLLLNRACNEMYSVLYRPLGFAILHGQSYGFTFPIWGYPAVIAGFAGVFGGYVDAVLPILQVAACTAVVALYLLPWRGWRRWTFVAWSLLLVPVFHYACYPLPDAPTMIVFLVVGLALRGWQASNRSAWLLAAGCAVAVGVNLRSELLLFSGCVFVAATMAFALRRTELPRRLFVFSLVLVASAVIGIAPWSLHTYRQVGTPLLGATNGPGWFYTGLGQLPGNPWGLVPFDSAPDAYAATKGIDDPFSYQGSRVLRAAIIRDIRRYPKAYAEKVAWNLGSALIMGVPATHDYYDQHLSNTTKTQRIRGALALHWYPLSWAFGTTVNWVFRVLFLLTCLLTLWIGARVGLRRCLLSDVSVLLVSLAALYTIFELALVSFGFYLPRFMTPLYALQVMVLTQVFLAEPCEDLVGRTLSAPVRAYRDMRARRASVHQTS